MTALHVVNGLREAKSSSADLICQVGVTKMDPLADILGEDPERDIATFALSENEFNEVGRTYHRPVHSWPPKLSVKGIGKGAFFGGYRAQDRKPTPGHITWGFAAGLNTATSIVDDRIAMQFNRDEWIEVNEPGIRTPEPHEPWGGASGAPVFVLIQNAILTWRLVAVVTEFSEEYEILYASSLSRVQSDGTIDMSVG